MEEKSQISNPSSCNQKKLEKGENFRRKWQRTEINEIENIKILEKNQWNNKLVLWKY